MKGHFRQEHQVACFPFDVTDQAFPIPLKPVTIIGHFTYGHPHIFKTPTEK
jgi:hypothetical protein